MSQKCLHNFFANLKTEKIEGQQKERDERLHVSGRCYTSKDGVVVCDAFDEADGRCSQLHFQIYFMVTSVSVNLRMG